MPRKRLILILLVTVFILLIPLVAMQFTNEVNWSVFDFIVAGALLIGVGMLCEIAIRKIRDVKYRVIVCTLIVLAFLLIWVELAIGIF